MKPTSTATTSTTSTKTTTSRQAPIPATSQSVSTDSNSVSNPNSSSITLTESDSMVVSAMRDLRAQAPSSHFYSPVYRPLCHPLSGNPSSTLHRPTRPPTTLELIYRYTRGHYTDEEVSRLEDDRTQDMSVPPQDRLPLRIAQALTQAINFDTIFSIEHLANRDLFLIDAFLHHSFFTSIRDQFVNEVTLPSESDLDYPPVRSYSLALIINNFKGLHQSVERLKQFSTDLGQNPSWFQSVNILLDKHQELATLIYNVQSRRNSLADLILPHIFNPVDDNRDFVDLLAQFHITYSNVVHLLASATTSTSFAYTYLQQIANAIKYNLNLSSEKFSADEAELPTTKQFLGLVTRDHNVDSVVQLLKATTLGSKPPSPQPSTQSIGTSTSPSVNTVVTAVQLQPSPPTTSAHASTDTAQPSCSQHQSDIEPCDSDDSMSSRISKYYSYNCDPNPQPRRTFPSKPRFMLGLSRQQQSSRTPSPQRHPPRQQPQQQIQQPQQPQPQQPDPAQENLPACYFCDESHYSSSCPNVTSLSLRYLNSAQAGRCLNCLKKHSTQQLCSRKSRPCRVCRELGHHPALCPASVHTAHDTGRFGVFFDSMYRIYKSYYNM